MRRHGSAWALALPTLALYVARDPTTVCKMNVWVVPSPSDTAFSPRSMRAGPAHTYAHSPPTAQTAPGSHHTGGALQGAPSTHQVRQGPRDPLWQQASCSSAMPLGGWQVCRSPKPSLLYAADVPPALGWCSVWGHPSAGHPSAPIQGRCPQLCSSLHPQISGCGCSPA